MEIDNKYVVIFVLLYIFNLYLLYKTFQKKEDKKECEKEDETLEEEPKYLRHYCVMSSKIFLTIFIRKILK